MADSTPPLIKPTGSVYLATGSISWDKGSGTVRISGLAKAQTSTQLSNVCTVYLGDLVEENITTTGWRCTTGGWIYSGVREGGKPVGIAGGKMYVCEAMYVQMVGLRIPLSITCTSGSPYGSCLRFSDLVPTWSMPALADYDVYDLALNTPADAGAIGQMANGGGVNLFLADAFKKIIERNPAKKADLAKDESLELAYVIGSVEVSGGQGSPEGDTRSCDAGRLCYKTVDETTNFGEGEYIQRQIITVNNSASAWAMPYEKTVTSKVSFAQKIRVRTLQMPTVGGFFHDMFDKGSVPVVPAIINLISLVNSVDRTLPGWLSGDKVVTTNVTTRSILGNMSPLTHSRCLYSNETTVYVLGDGSGISLPDMPPVSRELSQDRSLSRDTRAEISPAMSTRVSNQLTSQFSRKDPTWKNLGNKQNFYERSARTSRLLLPVPDMDYNPEFTDVQADLDAQESIQKVEQPRRLTRDALRNIPRALLPKSEEDTAESLMISSDRPLAARQKEVNLPSDKSGASGGWGDGDGGGDGFGGGGGGGFGGGGASGGWGDSDNGPGYSPPDEFSPVLPDYTPPPPEPPKPPPSPDLPRPPDQKPQVAPTINPFVSYSRVKRHGYQNLCGGFLYRKTVTVETQTYSGTLAVNFGSAFWDVPDPNPYSTDLMGRPIYIVPTENNLVQFGRAIIAGRVLCQLGDSQEAALALAAIASIPTDLLTWAYMGKLAGIVYNDAYRGDWYRIIHDAMDSEFAAILEYATSVINSAHGHQYRAGLYQAYAQTHPEAAQILAEKLGLSMIDLSVEGATLFTKPQNWLLKYGGAVNVSNMLIETVTTTFSSAGAHTTVTNHVHQTTQTSSTVSSAFDDSIIWASPTYVKVSTANHRLSGFTTTLTTQDWDWDKVKALKDAASEMTGRWCYSQSVIQSYSGSTSAAVKAFKDDISARSIRYSYNDGDNKSTASATRLVKC